MLLEMLLLLFVVAVRQVSAGSKTRGISPQDLEYFSSATIWCKDGTKSFPRERLNDNFCDCADGTDEPGTSACLEGKFYCKDTGITPRRVFASRVNDGICDCCDGSDEYEKRVKCTNQCKGPKLQQHTKNITMHVEDSRLKGLVIKLKGKYLCYMKGPLLLQMLGFSALICWQCVVRVRVIRRALSKKRRASHTSFL
ncbi:unnamed protein product [Sphagnum jensenii]|uniref:Glucosidase II beta subunit N-terminal domain-containing protein n=1 Tax=Sphagnum jensenii TaxID=128206 RepID=A0ABP1A8C1_9BRYO